VVLGWYGEIYKDALRDGFGLFEYFGYSTPKTD
jgi:hypothetical protein